MRQGADGMVDLIGLTDERGEKAEGRAQGRGHGCLGQAGIVHGSDRALDLAAVTHAG